MVARSIAKESSRRVVDAIGTMLWRSGFRRSNTLPVLTYHDVLPAGERPSQPYNSIAADQLERHIVELCEHGYQLCSLSEGWGAFANSDLRSLRRVALTFDDGTEGHARIVTPLLRRHNASATFYVLSSRFGETVQFGGARGRHVSKVEIEQMAGLGMEIGSHSRSHPVLSRMQSDRLQDEVAGSREEIGRIVGSAPRSFAYPFGEPGAFDERSVSAVRLAGYDSAVTTVIGTNAPGSDCYRLRRVPVYASDSPELVLAKVSGCFDWLRAFQRAWLVAFPARPMGSG